MTTRPGSRGRRYPDGIGLLATSVIALLVSLLTGCVRPLPTRVAPDRAGVAQAEARRAISGEQALASDSLPSRTVGIPPLRVAAADTSLAALGYGLADMLMTDLGRSSQVQIVDRLRMDALLRELKLAQAGLVDPATAPRVGTLVRARRLVLGDVTQVTGGQIGINARLADTRSGQVRPAVRATAQLEEIFRAEKELAYRLFTEMGVTLTPAERAAIEQRPTANLAAFLAYSRGVRYEVFGRFDDAAREYDAAARLDPAFVGASLRGRDARRRVRLTAALETAGAASFALARVNAPVPYSPSRIGGGVAEASFPSQTVTVLITITTRP